eukprot:g11682.t1
MVAGAVMMIATGKVYASIDEAAKQTGVKAQFITNALKFGTQAGDSHWCYEDDGMDDDDDEGCLAASYLGVSALDDFSILIISKSELSDYSKLSAHVYASIDEAAKQTGVKAQFITNALKFGTQAGDSHWCYEDDGMDDDDDEGCLAASYLGVSALDDFSILIISKSELSDYSKLSAHVCIPAKYQYE